MGAADQRTKNRINAQNASELLAFGKKKSHIHTDIRSFTDYVGASLNTVLDYEDSSKTGEFFYVSSGVEIGGLKIAASVLSPSRYQVANGNGFYFMFPLIGQATVSSDGAHGVSEAGANAYFGPEIERKGSTSELSMIQVSIDEARLTSVGSRMLNDKDFNRFRKSLGQPHLLPIIGKNVKFKTIFKELFKMIDESDQDNKILELLAIDDLFYRTLVLLIGRKESFDHEGKEARAYSRTIARRAAEYISAHHCRRLTQTELEEITGVSYRDISSAFKKEFGCSPFQWLGRYRLEALKLLLERPQKDFSLKASARACGFLNIGAIRITYAEAFGETPEETLGRSKVRC